MKKIYPSILSLLVLLLASCATMISGSRATIILDGDILEPVTVTTATDTIDSLSLPAAISLQRRDLNLPVTLTSPNYDYANIIPGRKTNPWVLANILNGGMGLLVDVATDALYQPIHERYTVVSRPKGNSAEATAPMPPLDYTRTKLNAGAAKPFDRNQFYRHEVNVLFGFGSSVWRGTHDQQVRRFYDVGMENSFFCGIDVNGVSWSIRYFYHLNPQLAIGATFGKASAYDGLETPYAPSEPEAYALSPYALVHTKSTFLMPAVKYSWCRSNGFSFYSVAALGVEHSHTWSSVHTVNVSIYPELAYEHHRQVVFNSKQWKLEPQLTAFGFDFGGRKFRFFAELGYGTEGVFNIGLSRCL